MDTIISTASPYSTRAQAYYEQGDYDRALADATRAVEIDSDIGLHYRIRGRIFAAMGLQSAARQDFQRGAALGDTVAQRELWTL
ncbi:MAG TPA: tetratricopeptide repeat protein [Chloroflexia bacterium]|nr:tetratricopeptide repeat protein [Chloroflexia bacterium]